MVGGPREGLARREEGEQILRHFLAIIALTAAACGFVPIETQATAAPPPNFTSPSFSAYEDAGTLQVTVTKSKKANSYSKVRVVSVDGSAHAGTDYQPVDVTLTFGNNVLTLNVPVPVINRSGYQADRDFQLKLIAVRNATVGPPATIYLHDRESAPPPTCPDGSPVPAGGCPVTPPPTCPDGSPIPASGQCPTLPPPLCPDGVTPKPPTGDCPTLPPSPYVPGPLVEGGFLRVKSDESGCPKPGGYFPKAYPCSEALYRTAKVGEVFSVAGSTYDSNNRRVWEAVKSPGTDVFFLYEEDVEGVKPQ
jgi:hypothetical protein